MEEIIKGDLICVSYRLTGRSDTLGKFNRITSNELFLENVIDGDDPSSVLPEWGVSTEEGAVIRRMNYGELKVYNGLFIGRDVVYKRVKIVWEDNPDAVEDRIIAICKNEGGAEDDKAFFMCRSKKDYDRLFKFNNGEDFHIVAEIKD